MKVVLEQRAAHVSGEPIYPSCVRCMRLFSDSSAASLYAATSMSTSGCRSAIRSRVLAAPDG